MTFFRKHLLWTLALAMAAGTVAVVQASADDHDRDWHKQQDRNWNRNTNHNRDANRVWNRREYRNRNNGGYYNNGGGYYNNGRSYPYSGNYGYGGNSPYYGGYAQNNDTQRAYQAGYNNGVNDRMRNKPLNLRTGNWHGVNLQAYERGYQSGYRSGGRGFGW
jgi:hypothetical protein